MKNETVRVRRGTMQIVETTIPGRSTTYIRDDKTADRTVKVRTTTVHINAGRHVDLRETNRRLSGREVFLDAATAWEPERETA